MFQISQVKLSNQTVTARTVQVTGKTAIFQLGGSRSNIVGKGAPSARSNATISSIVTIGKDSPTSLEEQVRTLIQQILGGNQAIFTENPAIKYLWNLKIHTQNLPVVRSNIDPVPACVTVRLNASQKRALQLFCTSDAGSTVLAQPSSSSRTTSKSTSLSLESPRVQLVHGPPGSGKTTLIAAIVQWLHGDRKGIGINEALYIVTQSNVAVKRVAEKLCDIGFLDFKLIISQDFYLEW